MPCSKVLDGPDTGTRRVGASGVISALLGLRAFDPVAGVATRAAAHRPGAEGPIIEQGAAEAVGLLPMLGQERCDYLMLLVDQLSPIV